MTHLLIESEANARVKRWKRLASDARFSRREGAAILEGIHLVEVAIVLPEVPADDVWTHEDALYLDGVQDSGNAGTLIRSAAAAGVRVVIASPGAACLWTPKVLRAGMGAHFSVSIIEACPVRQLRERYAGRLIAADARGGENLFTAPDYTAAGPICWMMGAEGPGLSEEALAATDERYWIPIAEGVESLNVAAAAAVCLFDSSRRRLLRSVDSKLAR